MHEATPADGATGETGIRGMKFVAGQSQTHLKDQPSLYIENLAVTPDRAIVFPLPNTLPSS
jgi:hypothetical protein